MPSWEVAVMCKFNRPTEAELAFRKVDKESPEYRNMAIEQITELIDQNATIPKWMISELLICFEMGFRLGFKANDLLKGDFK